jgi:MoxR-like ATPase
MINLQSHSLETIQTLLQSRSYIADDYVAMSVFLAMRLNKPLLIEGPAGVGKTEIAKVMANALDTNLIRLQCYEGLDASHAIYEWNYQHQLLYLKMSSASSEQPTDEISAIENTIFDDKFLLKRPLLQAITQKKSPVLLIDEVDRADEEFESFLLELLSDWQITIPEKGTIEAQSIPYVILTGNRTRELSEALRRRCLYLWIDYPTFEKELMIVKTKVPQIDHQLAEQITRFMHLVREQRLNKVPGIAETLDWAQALASMHINHLEKIMVEATLGVILKDWQDIRQTQMSLSELMEKIGVKSKWEEI